MDGPWAARNENGGGGAAIRDRVLQATDIVELIGQTVALKRRGKDFVGLCPFHQEKTPSFHVSPAKQYFRCYGCKAGGSAFDFVMKRDRVEFVDALRALADRAGIEMPRYGGAAKEKAGERQALYDANSAACGFFEKLLEHPDDGRVARAYLEARGFNAESFRRFRIGLAPDGWDGLLRSAVGRKFGPQQLLAAGLVKARESGSGFYDTFRNRLMFPIRDEAGRIIGFGGRVMPESEDPAKYLNSPETPIFSKGRCAYGIDLARQRIVETRTVAVVEGYTDVVMAHQFGASNVVSVLGTALTEQHVALLRRFADRIVLLFDPDTAGEAAVNRAVELFVTQPVEVAIATVPDGQDPDEYLVAAGAEAFERLLAEAPDALTFKWRQLDASLRASDDVTARQRAVESYLQTLASARTGGPVDIVRWGSILTRAERLTGIPVAELHRRFGAAKPTKRRMATPQASESGGLTNTAPAPRRPDARDLAERHLLGVLMAEPHHWADVQQHVSPEEFTEDLRRRLAAALWGHQRDEGETPLAEFLGHLDEVDLKELAVELVDEAESLENANRALLDAVRLLQELRESRQRQELVADLRRRPEPESDGGGGAAADQGEVEKLRRLQEIARKPDLRRVGS